HSSDTLSSSAMSLNSSSVAPSRRMMTFPAGPERFASSFRPCTKASITTSKATTRMKPMAVSAVVFQRTSKLRVLYLTGIISFPRSCHAGEYFGNSNLARIPGGDEAAEQGRRRPECRPPPPGVAGDEERVADAEVDATGERHNALG